MAKAPFKNEPLLTSEEVRRRLGEFYRALEEFNDGYYFEAHETLEALWLVTPWPERQFFQAIIQAAAAFVHLARGEYAGTVKLLDAAVDKLRDFAPSQFGVDAARLSTDLARVRDELAALGEERFREWDAARVPAIAFERVGG